MDDRSKALTRLLINITFTAQAVQLNQVLQVLIISTDLSEKTNNYSPFSVLL